MSMMSGGPSPYSKGLQGIARGFMGSAVNSARPQPSATPTSSKPKFLSNFINSTYGVGKRVYNGGTPSPHAGAGGVNPAGYGDRDQMANVKRQRLQQMASQRTF